jgi:hypothetical protein
VKKCPYCAEEIEDDTTTCPFCRSTLIEPQPARSAPPQPSTWAYGPGVSEPEAAPRQRAIRPWMFAIGAVVVIGVVWLFALMLGRSPDVPAAAQPTAAQPAVLAPGWTLANEAEDGFSIGLPENWEESDFDVGEAIKFQAIDAGNDVASLPFVPNLNIVAEPLPVELSLDDYVQANLSQLEIQLEGVVDLGHERVSLPAGPAERVTYRFDIGAGDGEEFVVSVVQFILLRDQTGYIFTFETAPAQATEYRALFEDMAETFRFTG